MSLPLQHTRMEVAGFNWKHATEAEENAKREETIKERQVFSTLQQKNTTFATEKPNDLPNTIEEQVRTQSIVSTVPSVEDVTVEYIENATPGIGSIIFDDEYDVGKHLHEVSIAEWLKTHLGGEIVLQNESRIDGEKMSDYLWNGKRWELKGPSTEKAPDSALRSGMAQIAINPGGIILDFKDNEINVDAAIETINNRMLRPESIPSDVLIIHKGKLLRILRYKK